MKSTMNMITKRLGIYRLAAILLLLGIVLGTIGANLLQRFYLNDLEILNRYFGSNIKAIHIDYGSLMKYIITNRLKEFCVVWICCCMVFGIPVLSCLIVYKGISIGFALSSSILCYGFKGITLYFAYIFPQCILYIPVYILMVKKGYELCENLYFNGKLSPHARRSLLKEYIPILALLLVFLGIGCLIETYINSAIVKGAANWIIGH
ncbi:stage II sporulation protein M [Anaerosporobacter faecicola]|uniref:stage II sporulation protein M n=1 Tax=Anaerosporobacter faecicola TaxID=2718714 RepID=UPI00143B9A40|nr:stage II sporulation protein M [Anaerosporobacter faecicola]